MIRKTIWMCALGLAFTGACSERQGAGAASEGESSEGAAQRPTAAAEGSGVEADPFTPLSEAELSARIERARAEAAASGRLVLLDFVADWCTDCREVVRLSRTEPARSVLQERFVVVYVEVGRMDRHRDLIREHSVDRIATLVALDPESGRRLARTTLEPITGPDRGLTSEALARWLRSVPTP